MESVITKKGQVVVPVALKEWVDPKRRNPEIPLLFIVEVRI